MTRPAEPRRRQALRAPALAATLLAGVLALGTGGAVHAQSAPGAATQRLADALHNLARDPYYLPSLIDAGQVSLTLEDPEGAMGFFRRAEAIAPSDGRVKAGNGRDHGSAGAAGRSPAPVPAGGTGG